MISAKLRPWWRNPWLAAASLTVMLMYWLLLQICLLALQLPRRTQVFLLALCLALLLSACGTAPSSVQTSPPVPAALMQPPQTPVLLPLASPSVTPGTTTKPTPDLAPQTGFGTKP